MTEGADRAGAAVEESALDTGLAQEIGGAVEGIPFSDGTGVEEHPWAVELDGAVQFVEVDMVPSDARACGG